MNELIQKLVQKKDLIERILVTVFGAILILLTISIYVLSPVQEHFSDLGKNDVWFGDNWYYSDVYGNIIDNTPIDDVSDHYMRLKIDDGNVIITKILDFTPSQDEYMCFRTRAFDVVVYVNDILWYEKHYKAEYRSYAEKMYTLHQFSAKGMQEGDKIVIEMYNAPVEGYSTFQFLSMGDRYALTYYIFEKSAMSLTICIIALFIIVINMVTTHSKILVDKVYDIKSLKWLTAFMVLAVIYLLADCGCMELLVKRSSFVSWITSISLTLLPIPFILFTQYAFFPGHKRYSVLALSNLILMIISVTSFTIFQYNMSHFFVFVHISIALDIVACASSFFQEKMLPSTEVILGFSAVIITAAISILAYWLGIIHPSSMIFGYGLLVFSVCMLVWIIRSRYEIKRMREEADFVIMQREKEAAEDASRQKTRFLTHMSHEIRTPLNAILGMNELIIRETKNENIKRYSDNIQNAGRTLLALVNDVLDFSKIETGKMDIIESDYSLSSVLNDIVLMLQGRINDKGLELRLDVQNEIPDILYGDEVRIKQIILNLMTNAIKYTDTGYILLCVKSHTMPTSKENNMITLEVMVTDTGIGIKKDDIPLLFDEFERLDRKKNKTVEGTGLGLSITSRLLMLMKGKISVESEYGKGSTFRVTIPQKVVSYTPIGDYKKRFDILSNEKQTDETLETLRFPGKSVYAVDDNEMNLDVIVSILEMLDIRVERANSGQAAINHLDKEKYDLILTDDMMPEINGTDVMKHIRKNKESASYETPIVVLTANAISGAREDYIKRGFDDYMTKPIDIDVLQKILMKYLK